ncbi:MAG UNVERIFIED_CONTAM: hypothetical protein LVQ98_01145 [Rickettsiaceae bacterium]|jgi:hypothetical protein
MTLPGNPGMGAKLQIWPQRGDREEAASCLMATKGGKPLGYFNIGSSAIKMTYQDKEISPNESGGFNGSLSPQDYAKVVYAATSYYNLVFTANPRVFQSEYVIYTTKDPVMAEALKAAGWTAPQDDFLKAVTSIEPELKDGRPARFALQEGLFAERCRVTDESPQRWHYGYETKEIFIHHFGETNIAPLVGDDSAGASATP